jgi:hypothetical protein
MRDQIGKTNQNGAPNCLLAIACLLFVFSLVAQIVLEGKSSAFDRSIILAFRDPGNLSAPIGPAWVQEAARDLTSLGSIIVLVIITAAFTGYLFLARKQAAAWLMLFAVFGGIALSDLLKFAFARPRPNFVAPAARVFTTSFPSGHAALSAITYHDRGASGAKPILVQDRPLFRDRGGASDRPHRHQPRLSWRSLSDGCRRRLVRRCGLGAGVLGVDGLASAWRAGGSDRTGVAIPQVRAASLGV